MSIKKFSEDKENIIFPLDKEKENNRKYFQI